MAMDPSLMFSRRTARDDNPNGAQLLGMPTSPGCWYQGCPSGSGSVVVWCICCTGGHCVPIPYTTPGLHTNTRIPATLDRLTIELIRRTGSGQSLPATAAHRLLVDLRRKVGVVRRVFGQARFATRVMRNPYAPRPQVIRLGASGNPYLPAMQRPRTTAMYY